MKNRILVALIFNMYLFSSLVGQGLDEETGFIYVKAEYLLETGRYDEAVTNYNLVITQNPGYKNALIHRGKAKYALGAYKGTQKDAMQSIELKGIQADNAALLGRAFAAMGESEAAINSFNAAILLDHKNMEYILWRAQIFETSGQRLKACADYETAAKAGNSEAEAKAKNYCGITIPNNRETTTNNNPNTTNESSNPTTSDNTTVQNDTNSTTNPQNTEVTTTVPVTDSTSVSDGATSPNHIPDSEPPIQDENLPKNDDTVNAFVVDDDLNIQISGQELGVRKIKEVPSILILSDENGKVCINICVNKEGQVIKAEFNPTLSTIVQKSLVSLALRKAKEFEFAPGKYDSQCGIIIFEVKGS
ncbi:MAG: tetratricopeptide repeat protein [Saprospiraceae bacterium]|jgi:tetratricopeptide (TPR) repeat protein|nr:tetratricopeptide repeat protein [Saprospiraceae bacterium]